MFKRFREDRQTRKRIKKFLARDPGYLTREQQIELRLIPVWDLDWSPQFLFGGTGTDEWIRKPTVMRIPFPDPKAERVERQAAYTGTMQTVHPALDALRNTKGKPMGLVVGTPVTLV